jgi:DNA-binding transcriptional regulator YhcF (GntR family)
MLFHVDVRNGLAVYEQIVRHIKFAIADGALRSGELVPSVRKMARDLAVNPNTVARANQNRGRPTCVVIRYSFETGFTGSTGLQLPSSS